MSSKCFFSECEFNKPVRKLRCTGQRRSHGKFGKRQSVRVSERCILGAAKRLESCSRNEELESPKGLL